MNSLQKEKTGYLKKEIKFYRRLGLLYLSLGNSDRLLKIMLNFIIRHMNVEAGTLFLLDSTNKNIVFNVVSGKARRKLIGEKLPVGAGIAGYVVKTGKPYLTKNAKNDKRWLREIGDSIRFKTRDVLCVPLYGLDGIIGTVEVINKKGRKGFTDSDMYLLKSGAGQLGVLIEHARFLKEANQRVTQLDLLRNIGKVINSTLKQGEIRGRTIESITRLLNCEAGSLLLLDENTRELYFDVTHGERGAEIKRIRLKLGEGIAGWVAEKSKSVIVNNVGADKRFYSKADKVSQFVTRNIVCVPIRLKGKVIGVIEAINKESGGFTKTDQELLSYLADQVAVAIENSNLYEDLRVTFLETSESLAEAIEQRDPYTGGHTRRVLNYCVATGIEMRLTDEEMDNLRLSAILHDIGKIGVEDRILRKPGVLDEVEFASMKKHPEIGAEIIRHIKKLEGVIPGILYHQEKYNGNGYPSGAKNGDIPLSARIISVCDTFDAMTTNRPYRKGLNVQAALDELKRFSGIQFDPDVIDAFISAYKKGKIKPEAD